MATAIGGTPIVRNRRAHTPASLAEGRGQAGKLGEHIRADLAEAKRRL